MCHALLTCCHVCCLVAMFAMCIKAQCLHCTGEGVEVHLVPRPHGPAAGTDPVVIKTDDAWFNIHHATALEHWPQALAGVRPAQGNMIIAMKYSLLKNHKHKLAWSIVFSWCRRLPCTHTHTLTYTHMYIRMYLVCVCVCVYVCVCVRIRESWQRGLQSQVAVPRTRVEITAQ